MSIWYKSKIEILKLFFNKFKLPVIVLLVYSVSYLSYNVYKIQNSSDEIIYKLNQVIETNKTHDDRLRFTESAVSKLINLSEVNYNWNTVQDVRLNDIESSNKLLKYNLLNIDNGQSKDRKRLTVEMKNLVEELRVTNKLLCKSYEDSYARNNTEINR